MRRLLPVTLVGLAAVLSVLCPSAATTPAAATRAVTLTLNATGRATWQETTPNGQASTTMRYRWRGSVRMVIPTAVLRNPSRARFTARGSATLVGGWDGTLSGTRREGIGAGPFRCTYVGRSARTNVGITLRNGRRRGRLELWIRPRARGFFSPSGPGADIECTSVVGAQAPPHFDPAWLFRDVVLDHGRFSYSLAVIPVPSRLLPRGLVRVRWPREVGRERAPLRGTFSWSNRGTTTIRAR